MIALLIVAGFALIATGTYRQSKLAFGRLPALQTRMACLGGGYVLLGLSLACVVFGDDVGRQIVQWFGLLSVGALLMMLAFWMRSLR